LHILASDRRPNVAEARRLAVGVLRALGLNASAIARAIVRDHSTILAHFKALDADPDLLARVERLASRLRAEALGEPQTAASDLYARLLPLLGREHRLAVLAYVLRELLYLPWRGFGAALDGRVCSLPNTLLGWYILDVDAAALDAVTGFLIEGGREDLADLLLRRLRRAA
jgi:hypothetical protein